MNLNLIQLTMLISEAVSFSAQMCMNYRANGNRLDVQSAEILLAENRANYNDHHQTLHPKRTSSDDTVIMR